MTRGGIRRRPRKGNAGRASRAWTIESRRHEVWVDKLLSQILTHTCTILGKFSLVFYNIPCAVF